MKNHGCDDGDCVTVAGQMSGGNFWLSDAEKVDDSQCQMALMSASLPRTIKAEIPPKSAAKKAVSKKTVKKSAESATKAATKTVAKKVAKKSTKQASKKGMER